MLDDEIFMYMNYNRPPRGNVNLKVVSQSMLSVILNNGWANVLKKIQILKQHLNNSEELECNRCKPILFLSALHWFCIEALNFALLNSGIIRRGHFSLYVLFLKQ